jgi:hypothetical protein
MIPISSQALGPSTRLLASALSASLLLAGLLLRLLGR